MSMMKMKLLFICLGNICRSPAAEGIMRQMVEERALSNDIIVDSAGIGSWHVGEMPDPRMRKHAARRGYDLSPLRARQFRADDFQKFDYIIVMDEENYHDVMERGGVYADARKVLRMKDYFIRYKGQQSVPDPYYGGAEGFERALNLIEDGCEGLFVDVVKKIKG
jgi:protein-tyrosine phosphatase